MTAVRHWPTLTVSAAVLGLAWWSILASEIGERDAPSAKSASRLISTSTEKPVPGADLFTNGTVRRIRLEIAPGDVAELRRDSRKYVPATVREGKEVYPQVAIHLKGSTGSFRSIDDKPGLTLSFGRFKPSQRFHGLSKIHLNNSVEDPSYLNEQIGGELFRAAGVPAPRIAHALVELNDRSLGLYVLKEGFTEDLLGLHFRQTKGNLYDPGAGHDVDEPLERDSGDGPEDRADLQALTAAAREPNLDERWQRLAEVLDLERFTSFMAMEVMTGHRDGYCLARNNYRVYHDLDTGRMIFFPHGLDQLFGKAELPWQPHMAGLVARAFMETREGRRHYRERFALLFTNVFKVPARTARANRLAALIRPALDRGAAQDLERSAAIVMQRIVQRQAHLQKQLSEPELAQLQFVNGVARLSGWRITDKPSKGKMEQGQAPDSRPALQVHVEADASASWRTQVSLAAGRYRFEGRIRTAGVVPLKYGKNLGAGLRVSGFPSMRRYDRIGDSPWAKVEVEFEVTAASALVELVCELRASRGSAWFDLESLRLVRLE